jgi:D-amino-acid dehydrogenase
VTQQQPHCIVIGAGIVGASCAWHLQQRGARVTLVDSNSPGQATSFGNAGCISPSSIYPFSYPGAIRQVPGWLLDPLGPMKIRWGNLPGLLPWFWRFWREGTLQQVQAISTAQHQLMRSATADYDAILQATGSESLRQSNGLILLYTDQAEFDDDRWHFDIKDQFQLPWSKLSHAELHDLEPDVRLNPEGLAVIDHSWQHLLSPADVTQRIAESALANGARWIQDRVTQVSAHETGAEISTASGQKIAGDYLVLATGVWTNTLLKQLGHRVPLTAKRGYHSMLAQPNVKLSHPLMQIKEYIVMTPMRDGLRVAGTAEFAHIDAKPDYRRAKALLQHAQRFLPGLKGESVTEWMGQRPMLPDSIPVLGKLPGRERVLCAFGHGHYGITQGPTSGRIIADLVFGQQSHVDIKPFSITRFSGRKT